MLSREEEDKQLFDRIADSYTRKDRINYCRHARKHRLIQTISHIDRPVSTLLEVGCGAGFSSEYLRGKYQQFLGVDYSNELIHYAKELHGSGDVTFETVNIHDFEPDQKFDVILMIGVLHHMPDPEKALAHVKDMLSTDGVVVVNEPQKGNPLISLMRWVRKNVDSKYSSDQVEFTENELKDLFESANLDSHSFPQGFFSTPFAETRFLPDIIGTPLSYLAVSLDCMMDQVLRRLGCLRLLAWNTVVYGRLKA